MVFHYGLLSLGITTPKGRGLETKTDLTYPENIRHPKRGAEFSPYIL